ncbi:protein phosphatase 2C 3-like [Momordica charantia]|uniref:protein-serine/threonine phosphatase n=1 Tax=Momordica charantia TaxID=3673 RepID=A0A6J1BVK4_MOMCH|nr:protein phosphatase 2C 3-like [Momordica charantia]
MDYLHLAGRKRRGVHDVFPGRHCQNADDDENNNYVVKVKYGVTSVCGIRRDMEDAVSVHPFFAALKTDHPLHFFGVFDGHGCSHVSMSCENRMHEIVKEEMIENELGGETVADQEEWKRLMQRSFARMDEEVREYRRDTDSDDANQTTSCRCQLHTLHQYDTVGSTALVAVLTPHNFIISNCGDSRAVLCRKKLAIPLSNDHKPDRPDELVRIESSGGRVINWDGPRVLGVLATSRAIGDGNLKPYVISEPEVVVMDRTAEDEFVVLATDGLWDVVSNDTACEAVRTCMRAQRDRPTSSLAPSQSSPRGMGCSCDKTCSDASIVLTKLAMARHSSDNISVVVIDLRRDRIEASKT